MANYATLKAAIEAVIYENHDNEITGQDLQNTLIAMVNSLGSGYQFVDIATPTTNPGTPDQNVFYIAATPGTYSNFGSIVLAENEVAILAYNGTWTKKTTGAASASIVSQLVQEVDDTLVLDIPFYEGYYYLLFDAAVGSTITRQLVSAPGYGYVEVDCKPGDVFSIFTKQTSAAAKAYAILKDDGEVLAVQQASSNTGFIVEIPENGAALIVNSSLSSSLPQVYCRKKLAAIENLNDEADKLKERNRESFFVNVPFVEGKYVNLTNVVSGTLVTISTLSAAGYGYAIVDVDEGQSVKFTTNTNSASAKAFALLDKDGRCVLAQQSAVTDKTLVIPPKAVKLIVNTKITASTYLKAYNYNLAKEVKTIADENKTFINGLVKQTAVLVTGKYINLTGLSVGDVFEDFKSAEISFAGYGYWAHQFADNFTIKIKTSANTSSAKSYAVISEDYIVKDIKQTAGTYTINVEAGDFVIVNTSVSSYSIDIDGEWIGSAKKGRYQDFVADNLSTKEISLRNKNTHLTYDGLTVQRAEISALRLVLNKNVPLDGACISVDHLNDEVLSGSSTMDEIQAKFVPFLYWQQKKIGTIVLYDDTTGKPYIFDKNGVKQFLTLEI